MVRPVRGPLGLKRFVMRNILKAGIVGLILMGAFMFFALRYSPTFWSQKPPHPPQDRRVDVTAMTRAELEALGADVFHGKGTCTLCHDPIGARAPVLKDIFRTSSERIREPGYRGGAGDASAYLYESLVDPSAYVVKGYGVAGSKDTVSPMPDVRTPAIGMDAYEIRALIAYLEGVSDPYSANTMGQHGRSVRSPGR